MVQNFAVFADRSVSAKTAASAIAPRLPVRAGATKIKTAKIYSGALRGDSAKFSTRENFPLYGMSNEVVEKQLGIIFIIITWQSTEIYYKNGNTESEPTIYIYNIQWKQQTVKARTVLQ